MASLAPAAPYPARLRIDHPERLDRATTLLRVLWAIPILVILSLVTSSGGGTWVGEQGQRVRDTSGSIVLSIGIATALMIVFRQRYPRWWFDFQLALARFFYRVAA